MANANRPNVKYVYDLPYFERKELCRILDNNDKWEELGGNYMNFDVMTIQYLRQHLMRGKSPTDELLTMWGHQNHTVLELFVLLSKMQHYQSMLTLKPFVAPQYHRLIYEGEENLSRIFHNPSPVQPSPLQFTPQPGCPSSPSKNDPPCINRNIYQPVAGPSSGAIAQPPALHMHPPIVVPPTKSMEVGQHNLNTPDPPRVQGKVAVPEKSTPAGNRSEEKIMNTHRVPVAPQPPSNEENANVRSERQQVQATGIRGPPEDKETNIAPPRSPKAVNRTRASDAAGASSVAESYGSIPHITYKELLLATNGWAKETILGKGGFGTVFKGTWKNTLVAIKKIELKGGETASSHQAQMEQSLREMKFLNSYRHDNILPLYGYSLDGEEPCLLYQFMPNGSLEDRLLCRSGTPPLSWLQRYNIARGTARGLQFLHTIKEPLIHGDIKSANILLDQNFEARIGDFGLAREGPNSQYTHIKVSRVHGTRPYLPDEFLRSKQFSSKVDTYSFGIVLFELATGLRAYDDGRARKFLKDYVEFCAEGGTEMSLIDKRLESTGTEWHGAEGGVVACPSPEHNIGNSIFMDLLSLGKLCVKRRPGDRPEMVLVLQKLDGMAKIREIDFQVLSRMLSITPSNPYERQLYYDQLLRMSPRPISPPRPTSPMGQSPNPGMSQVPPPSVISTASTVPMPQRYLYNNPQYFLKRPWGAINQYPQMPNPINNPMLAPRVLLVPRVPIVHIHPPSPIPLEDDEYDGGNQSQAPQGIQPSMTELHSEQYLPRTIPGQGSDSISETLTDRVGREIPHPETAVYEEVLECESRLLPLLSELGFDKRSSESGNVVVEPESSPGSSHLTATANQAASERSGPETPILSPSKKPNPIFDND